MCTAVTSTSAASPLPAAALGAASISATASSSDSIALSEAGGCAPSEARPSARTLAPARTGTRTVTGWGTPGSWPPVRRRSSC
jgi:hypothetical protein